MQKLEMPLNCSSDRAKIVAMKRELNYQYGLIIDLPARAGAEQREYREYLDEWL